jgi:hypothetical protein
MYTDEELEQIRGSGGNSECPNSRIIKRHFIVSMLVSSFATVLIIYLSLSSLAMVSVATSVGGSGGFLLEFQEIKQETLAGEDPDEFFIYPVVAETSKCESTVETPTGQPDPTDNERALPLLKAQIEEADITSNTSLSFKKGITTPNILGLGNITVKVNNNITDTDGNVVGYGDVEIGNTSIIISELSAKRLQLTDASIDERVSDPTVAASESGFEKESPFGPSTEFVQSPDPANLGELVVSGEGAKIVSGSGIAHFVSFGNLRITNLNLEIEYNDADAPVSTQKCPI